jgi:hypothetical protein
MVFTSDGSLLQVSYDDGSILHDLSESLMSLTHNTGALEMAVYNDGSLGASNADAVGPGISWKGQNGVYVGGLIFGSSARGSVNGLLGSFTSLDPDLVKDIRNVQSEFVSGFTSDSHFDQITYAVLSDHGAEEPYGVNIVQTSYSNTGEHFGVIRYGFVNMTDSPILDFYAGIFIDWDVGADSYYNNCGGYALDENLVYTYSPESPNYFGIAALDSLAGMKITDLKSLLGDGDGVRAASFEWISNKDEEPVVKNSDVRSWIGTWVGDIAPGDTAWVTFAVLAGDDLLGLRMNAVDAFTKAYNIGWIDQSVPEIPQEITLYQNYPNPFNSRSVIKYHIPQSSQVSLKLFDVLGREVATLVDGLRTAGTYEVEINANALRGLSSGIYIYQLKAGSVVKTRKLVVVR